jgi:hypothetical protein
VFGAGSAAQAGAGTTGTGNDARARMKLSTKLDMNNKKKICYVTKVHLEVFLHQG